MVGNAYGIVFRALVSAGLLCCLLALAAFGRADRLQDETHSEALSLRDAGMDLDEALLAKAPAEKLDELARLATEDLDKLTQEKPNLENLPLLEKVKALENHTTRLTRDTSLIRLAALRRSLDLHRVAGIVIAVVGVAALLACAVVKVLGHRKADPETTLGLRD